MKKIDNTRFISFEGIDFSGKTTQIELLKDYLEQNGETVYILREPGGTVISEKIRRILLDKTHNEMNNRAELFLYSAARVQLVTQNIIPILKKGAWVIADRYVDSTTAYQGYGRGIDLQVIQQINNAATFGLQPRITFYMHLNNNEAQKRRIASGRESDRMESAGQEFYKRIIDGYQKLTNQFPDRFLELDASHAINEIHRQIITKIFIEGEQ